MNAGTTHKSIPATIASVLRNVARRPATKFGKEKKVSPFQRPSGGNLKRHVGTHDGGEQPSDEGDDATDRAAEADAILLIIDGEVSIEPAR